MSTRPARDRKRPTGQPANKSAMIQATAVGFAFFGALLLVGIVFLATGRGSESETIWVFPVWVVLFVVLIWNVSSWPQALARGLALWGAECLGLPPAWLIYQGLPALTAADPRLQETLSVMGFALIPAAALFTASFVVRRRAGIQLWTPAGRALATLAAAVFVVEVVYGILLGVSLLRG